LCKYYKKIGKENPNAYPSNEWYCGLRRFAELHESKIGNPMMTFPIKKRINTEPFIDRAAALYKWKNRIRDKNITIKGCA